MSAPPELARLELGLLQTLRALLESGGVSEAARLLGRSQPSTSRALARLRTLLGDPLLVSDGRGMQRTARARALQPRVAAAVSALEALFVPPAPFEPATEQGTLRVAGSEAGVALALVPWLARLREEAPGLSARVEAVRLESVGALQRGELELAVSPFAQVEGVEHLVTRPLLAEPYVCALREGHPALAGAWDLERYLALSHVMVSAGSPGRSSVQLALQRLARTRRVALAVPSFSAALGLVRDTELVASVPGRLARAAGLRVRPLPLEVEPMRLHLWWHPRNTSDARHRWLREGLRAACASNRETRVGSASARGIQTRRGAKR